MSKRYELDAFWNHLIRSYINGETAQPPYMGLSDTHFVQLFDDLIDSEFNLELLATYKNEHRHYSEQAVYVIAHSCLGYNHLWADLGLSDRDVLNEMIHYYFPKLHQLNQNNMRWKRFFYRQLCESEGDYICRSPSCEHCVSYNECFI